jgi:hypothetical protein
MLNQNWWIGVTDEPKFEHFNIYTTQNADDFVAIFGQQIAIINDDTTINSIIGDADCTLSADGGDTCSNTWAVRFGNQGNYLAVGTDSIDNYSDIKFRVILYEIGEDTLTFKKKIDFDLKTDDDTGGGIVGGCGIEDDPNSVLFAIFGSYPNGGGGGIVKITYDETTSQLSMTDNSKLTTNGALVHNCYQFTFDNEVKNFAATITPPWYNTYNQENPNNEIPNPIPQGLIEFSNDNLSWGSSNLSINVRSAVQIPGTNKVAALSQEPSYNDGITKTITYLYMLNWDSDSNAFNPEPLYKKSFKSCPGSEGSGDVLLDPHNENILWISIRGKPPDSIPGPIQDPSPASFCAPTTYPMSQIYTISYTTDGFVSSDPIYIPVCPRYMTFIDDKLYICGENNMLLIYDYNNIGGPATISSVFDNNELSLEFALQI